MKFRLSHLRSLALLTLLSAGCGERSVGPSDLRLEIVVMSGDGQLTASGGDLAEPLAAMVRRLSGEPAGDVQVHWEVLSGEGVVLSDAITVTDSLGRAEIGGRVGSDLGSYVIQADVDGRVGEPSRFEIFAVHSPEILELPESAVVAGETIRIGGRHFRAEPGENSVFFSAFRGDVVSGSEEELMVRVPACLPSREVVISVVLSRTVAGTAATPLEVVEGGEPLLLEMGEALILDDTEGPICERLPPDPNARYLALPHSSSSLVGATHAFGLVGRSGSTSIITFDESSREVTGQARSRDPEDRASLPQARWDHMLRTLEERLLPMRPGERESALSVPPALSLLTPQVGDRREFNVLNRSLEFEKVTAEIRHVGTRALIYQDLTAPAGGLSAADFAAFAQEFDEMIFPTVTGVFGAPSDLDGNDRIIILFTPVVNRLTPPGSSGFIGGFFYGVDLLPDRAGSNKGEVFYTLVPDPTGQFGDARPRDAILRTVPAILAHEFQHMVHFNERVLVRSAPTTEALWLSEGLAQMAEDVVSEAFAAQGQMEAAERYQSGNLARGRRYIENPGAVSLIPVTGGGTVEERGAGWLFLRYLRGHDGEGNALLRSLTQTQLTGISNVHDRTGRSWQDLVASWSGALYLDGLGLPVEPHFEFPDIRLRDALRTSGGLYPLFVRNIGPGDFIELGSLRSSSPAYFLVRPSSGGTALTLAGPDGLPTAQNGRLRLTLVRVQ